MTNIKCYLRGAYGPGNLGDDILMICAYKSLRKIYSADEIFIGVDSVELGRHLIPEAKLMHIKKPFSAKLVVLGGGGQFFSFAPPVGTIKDGFLKRLSKAIKQQSSVIDAAVRVCLRAMNSYDDLYLARRVVGYCLGLGPFDSEGKNYDRARKVVPRLSYISVRDATSAGFYSTLTGKSAKLFTDPSFNAGLWIEGDREVDILNGDYISIIVRDWPHDERGQRFIDAMFDAADKLKLRGENVRFISLYQERDLHLKARAHGFEWISWEVGKSTPCDFVKNICSSSKVIVSARAHGVMLPAAFGCPTVVVEIEPKLLEIHKMLPTGTLIVGVASSDELVRTVDCFLEQKTQLIENIVKEYSVLEDLARHAESDLLEWITSEHHKE